MAMDWQNVSKKRSREVDDDDDDLEEPAQRWEPPVFKKTYQKPKPLRSRREDLLREVVGSVTADSKRKRDEEAQQEVTKQQRQGDSEDRRPDYPDDSVLLDMCFGGRARTSGIKRSTLLITVTTNKTAMAIHSKTDLDNLKQDMDNILTNIIENKDNWIPKLNTQGWGVIDVEFSKPSGNRIIDGVKNKAAINELAWEEGVRFKRLHVHVMATLTYQNFNGYFHLNKRLLWEQLRYSIDGVDWGEKLPYINIRYIKNAVDSVADYINKLHNKEEYETLAKRTLDRINEYQQTV